ncbi:metal ABC transporter ATP-binding protein [Stetteria hydrogenophila]
MTASIEVRDVWVYYGDTPALRDVNLRLEGLGLVVIIGPNGAGKTTLLKTILGLIRPAKGKVIVNGLDVTGSPEKAGRLIGYVPQLVRQSFLFPITPFELVSASLKLRGFRGDRRKVTEHCLTKLRLPREAWYKPLSSLSGGMLQRVLIAKALAWDPPILVLDEPLSAVDARGRSEIAELIGNLSRDKLVVVTTHDPILFIDHARLVVVIGDGRVVAVGRPEEVLKVEVLRKVYGAAARLVEGYVHIGDFHAHA